METLCTKDLDEKLSSIDNIQWLPWIGKNYDNTRIIVLGESQYEDGDKWQLGNYMATRILIEKQIAGHKGKLYTKVETLLSGNSLMKSEKGHLLWDSIMYGNLVQRLMSSIKERPNVSDFDNGWAAFFKLVEIVKPAYCIVLGKSSCGRLGYYLNNNETCWKRNVSEFYEKEKIINLSNHDQKLKLVFINHPSGSRGFRPQYWADLINANIPTS